MELFPLARAAKGQTSMRRVELYEKTWSEDVRCRPSRPLGPSLPGTSHQESEERASLCSRPLSEQLPEHSKNIVIEEQLSRCSEQDGRINQVKLRVHSVTHVGEALKLSALVLRDHLIQQHTLGAVQLLVSHAHPDIVLLHLRDTCRTTPGRRP